MKAPRRIGLVLLAAGESRRMGTPNQLLPFEGKPLVRHAAQVAVASGCSPVVVVLGSSSQNIAPALEGLPVRAVTNSRWAEGMGTSIQAGLAALAPEHLDGVVITLADQPFVNAAHLAHLIAAQRRSNRPIIASEYSGTAGIPALFMRPVFDELNADGSAIGADVEFPDQ